jgi:hypothetical protein
MVNDMSPILVVEDDTQTANEINAALAIMALRSTALPLDARDC